MTKVNFCVTLSIYEVKKETIAKYVDSLKKIIVSVINTNNYNYKILVNKLELLNPLNILGKGYSLVTLDEEVISDSKKVKKGDNINIRLAKGNIKAEVKEID